MLLHSKDEATNCNTDVADGNNFKSFSYKAKLLRKTEIDGADGILKKHSNCSTIKVSK